MCVCARARMLCVRMCVCMRLFLFHGSPLFFFIHELQTYLAKVFVFSSYLFLTPCCLFASAVVFHVLDWLALSTRTSVKRSVWAHEDCGFLNRDRSEHHSINSQSDNLVGLVVKVTASRAADPGFDPRLRMAFFFFFFLRVESNKVLGLLAQIPVSVYCNWVNCKPFSVAMSSFPFHKDRLVGLVIKASASRAEDPGFESRLRRDFFGVDSYQ